ncbi:MAG: Type 4 prepilin-like proteins leader peptide-processing enzyme [Candidatus Dichloromethanomonas elyunquensis]|nr:MAG: Type 4 prepilin-like proteins leader peptide-processing enzyme [Candidatus Dichloromethanomonas elyunquensis]
MITVIALLIGVLGLVIGSFLNVVIYRVPKGESIVSPGSHCTECGHYLRPWELIPVLSYLILKGRCSKCGTAISRRYPAVELLTGFLFVLTFLLRTERTVPGLICDIVFVSLLIALTFIDLDTFRLPDVLVSLVALIGAVNTFVTGDPVLWRSLLGALGIGGIFFLVAYLYPGGMGMGDVKFVAALGLYLGSPNIFIAIFVASLFGSVIGGLHIITYQKQLKDPIPFGPFLAGGALLLLFCEDFVTALIHF